MTANRIEFTEEKPPIERLLNVLAKVDLLDEDLKVEMLKKMSLLVEASMAEQKAIISTHE